MPNTLDVLWFIVWAITDISVLMNVLRYLVFLEKNMWRERCEKIGAKFVSVDLTKEMITMILPQTVFELIELYLSKEHRDKIIYEAYCENVLRPVLKFKREFIDCIPLEYTPEQYWARIWSFLAERDPAYIADVEKEMINLGFFPASLYNQMKQVHISIESCKVINEANSKGFVALEFRSYNPPNLHQLHLLDQ